MPSDEYREAQAEAAAARARARALRPWYRKKRFILGIPVLVFVVFVIGAAARSAERANDDEDASTAASASSGAASGAPSDVAGIGTLVRVGDLDLTVVAAEPFDGRAYSAFNDANYRVRFRATNSRGPANAEYSLTELAFKLVDEDGVAQNGWYTACQACPDNAGGGKSIIRDGTFEGSVYFKVPAGKSAVELRYQAVLSNNRARIALR